MLDTLTFVELREMPLLPEPRVTTKEKMLAVAALIDVPVDVTPFHSGILPRGCWWMPAAQLVLYGSACQRPILLNEVGTICKATGLSGLIVRDYNMRAAPTRYTFDVYHGGSWHLRHLLWISEGGTGWLVPDGGDDSYLRLSQCGPDMTNNPPFLEKGERLEGLVRGADYLASFRRWG